MGRICQPRQNRRSLPDLRPGLSSVLIGPPCSWMATGKYDAHHRRSIMCLYISYVCHCMVPRAVRGRFTCYCNCCSTVAVKGKGKATRKIVSMLRNDTGHSSTVIVRKMCMNQNILGTQTRYGSEETNYLPVLYGDTRWSEYARDSASVSGALVRQDAVPTSEMHSATSMAVSTP
jgi:hypothetical protein